MNAFLVEEVLTDGSKVFAVEVGGLVRLNCVNEAAAIALKAALSGLCEVKILPPLASDCAEGIYREGWNDGSQFEGDASNFEGAKLVETESWEESYARQMYA